MKKLDEAPLRSSLRHEHNSNTRILTQSFRRSVHFSNEINSPDFEVSLVHSLESVGNCSLWIILLLILTSWICILMALENTLFMATKMINYTCHVQTHFESNWNFEMKRKISTPIIKGSTEQCLMYDINYLELSHVVPYQKAVAYVEAHKKYFKIKPCSHIISNDTYPFKGFTFVDVHLHSLCKKLLQEYLLISGWCGRLLTDIPMGIAADIYGRRCVIQITTVICFFGLLILLLSKNVWSLLIGRLIVGSGGHTSFLIFFLYFTEMCSKDSRTVLCQIVFVGWGVGYMLAIVLMYYLKHIWYLHCSSVTLILVSLFGIWYIPESPRWLVTQKRYEDARRIIREVDETELQVFELTELPCNRSTIKEQLNIFYLPGLRKRILQSMLMCAASLLAYYMSQKLTVNLHINLFNFLITFSISSFVHPLFALLLIKFLGKRLSITFVYALLTVLYFAVVSQDANAKIQSTLFVLLINCSSLAHHLTIAHTVEMYPVAFSGTVLGICTSFGTLVVIFHELLDSYINAKLINHIWYMMFTGAAMFIVLRLPETYGKLLPLTVHSARVLK